MTNKKEHRLIWNDIFHAQLVNVIDMYCIGFCIDSAHAITAGERCELPKNL